MTENPWALDRLEELRAKIRQHPQVIAWTMDYGEVWIASWNERPGAIGPVVLPRDLIPGHGTGLDLARLRAVVPESRLTHDDSFVISSDNKRLDVVTSIGRLQRACTWLHDRSLSVFD